MKGTRFVVYQKEKPLPPEGPGEPGGKAMGGMRSAESSIAVNSSEGIGWNLTGLDGEEAATEIPSPPGWSQKAPTSLE